MNKNNEESFKLKHNSIKQNLNELHDCYSKNLILSEVLLMQLDQLKRNYEKECLSDVERGRSRVALAKKVNEFHKVIFDLNDFIREIIEIEGFLITDKIYSFMLSINAMTLTQISENGGECRLLSVMKKDSTGEVKEEILLEWPSLFPEKKQ